MTERIDAAEMERLATVMECYCEGAGRCWHCRVRLALRQAAQAEREREEAERKDTEWRARQDARIGREAHHGD